MKSLVVCVTSALALAGCAVSSVDRPRGSAADAARPARKAPAPGEIVLIPAPRIVGFPADGKTVRVRGRPAVEVDPSLVAHAQGYRLDIAADGTVAIRARDEAGAFYGRQTYLQLARQFEGSGAMPVVHIEDWPDFPVRGVMLDIARDKVPTMKTLRRLVDMLAGLKYNQLQLYTEHTFAYKGHEDVWKDASPMTGAEIRDLDAYCRKRFIELVPNQNSFGHMERWLKHPRYAALAETPDGKDLCPVDPASIELLRGMYADLLPNFSSRHFNVGCDETWSLGKGRSKDEAARLGLGRVYLNFLKQIHQLAAAHGKTMEFWGDIIMQHPELIPDLPSDVIAMEWGYEARHPFAEHGRKFAAAKIPFHVVPGTSSWNSLLGRTDNAMENLRNAALNGLANGATGLLVTDWGDNGHWQFLPVSFAPFAYGAAVSWAFERNRDLPLARALDAHVFLDAAGVMGQAALD
ncbi:MAG: family 20 glycosylhydrolase, partial [Verrucomicrobia bacterium]|nr:family 20 glycosylhydrolase [Verrucomicrobiota bacterium]